MSEAEIQHFPRTGWSGQAAATPFPWRVSASRTRFTLGASTMGAYRFLPVSGRRQGSTRGWSSPGGFSLLRAPVAEEDRPGVYQGPFPGPRRPAVLSFARRGTTDQECLAPLLRARRQRCGKAAPALSLTESALIGAAMSIVAERLLAGQADRLAKCSDGHFAAEAEAVFTYGSRAKGKIVRACTPKG